MSCETFEKMFIQALQAHEARRQPSRLGLASTEPDNWLKTQYIDKVPWR
jgi:hypothetical protein